MDSIYAIGAGLLLRVAVDIVSENNVKVGGIIIGLWEGVVLYHFLGKMPSSFDPYVAYGFRLFVDFLITESLFKTAIVMLWTGMGVLLADITPAIWKDSGLRRIYRRAWVRLPRLPFVPKVGIPSRSGRTVQFWDSQPPTPSSAASDISTVLPVPPPRTTGSGLRSHSPYRSASPPPPRNPSRPLLVVRRSRGPPGALPGVWSEAETETEISSTTPTTETSQDTSTSSGTALPAERDGPSRRYSGIPDIDGALAADLALQEELQDQLTTPKADPTDLPHPPPAPPYEEELEYAVVDSNEIQPPFDEVPVIPDPPNASTTSLLLPTTTMTSTSHVLRSPIPPMPIANIPVFTDEQPLPPLPPPVPQKMDTVYEGDLYPADIPLPPSDDRTVAPPYDEWTHVESLDVPANRKSYADSDITPPESVFTNGNRSSLITRANLLREQAEEEDKIRAHLENSRKQLVAEGNVKDAFLLKGEVEEAENRAKKLHEKAERRYFDGKLLLSQLA